MALCVLNDLYRESAQMGVQIRGVAVEADGGFDEAWISTGVAYRVTVDSDATPRAVDSLILRVDAVAEIPRALRAGVPVGCA